MRKIIVIVAVMLMIVPPSVGKATAAPALFNLPEETVLEFYNIVYSGARIGAGYRIFTVDTRQFPNLAGLARDLADKRVFLVTILDPGVKHDRAVLNEGLAGNAFCTLPDKTLARAPVWPGWCAFPDFTDPRARAWWGRQYPRLLVAGITGFWHDMNEPAAFAIWGDPTLPHATRHAPDGRGGDHREAHNLYGLLMNQAGYEALRAYRPQRRPFILSRSGWAGVQRYAWNWTGDVESTWEALRQTVATVLGLALSGIAFTGPDVGGFSGAPSAELYLRWFQLATFLPFFRTHSAKFIPRREPWSFGEPTLSIAREFLKLRYRLLPYLYTLAWTASQTGHPLVRPLFWPDGKDPTLWDVQDEFLLGESLLVAPVLVQGAQAREVILPEGTWYGFFDDRTFRGPGRVRSPPRSIAFRSWCVKGASYPWKRPGTAQPAPHLCCMSTRVPGAKAAGCSTWTKEMDTGLDGSIDSACRGRARP